MRLLYNRNALEPLLPGAEEHRVSFSDDARECHIDISDLLIIY